jgi:pyruvyl transferase EpsO
MNTRPAPDGEQPADGVALAVSKAAALVDTLRARIDATVRPLLRDVTRVALLDVPVHENIGDSAILMGTLALLHRAGKHVCYVCSIDTYSRPALARRLGDGVILLSGGGNLGDLWPRTEEFRHRVLADFPDTRVIQLPQTMYYARTSALDEARAAFDAHPRFTMLLRDAHSLDAARSAFRAPCALCPDMAFALGPLPRRTSVRTSIVWLARRDREASPSARPVEFATIDWTSRRRTLLGRSERLLREWIGSHPRVLERASPVLGRLATWSAGQRFRAGCAMLAGGRAVITDRLHGHILSLLLGIPHAVLDNNYGKVRQFYETWTSDATLARWAETPSQALEAVAQWAT